MLHFSPYPVHSYLLSHQSLPFAIFLPSLLDRFIFLNKKILQKSSRDFIKMASDDGIRGVTCNAILEKLGTNGEVASVKKFPNSNVSIIRISGSQIGLSIQFRSVSINLEIEKGSLKGRAPPLVPQCQKSGPKMSGNW